jgi:hypothetical protein
LQSLRRALETILGARGTPRSALKKREGGWSNRLRVELWHCSACDQITTVAWVPTWINAVARQVDQYRHEILMEHNG